VNDPVRVAVIGAGRQGARHIATYQRLELARLVAVADPSTSARRAALSGLPACEYDDWRRLLDELGPSLDAVSVACPSAMHAEVAAAALETGLHVLVEKPIATDLADALALEAVAARTGRKLMVGHIERFNPVVSRLRGLIGEGRLGEIFRVHCTRIGPSPMRDLSSGVALDLATHDLDAMEYVLQRNLAQVFADSGRFKHGHHEDMMTCLLRFDGGLHGLLDVNWLTPEKQRELVVIGEAGMLRASYLTQDLWFIESSSTSTVAWDEFATIRGDCEGSAIRFALRRVEPMRAELTAFLTAIVEDLPVPVTARDGIRALAAAFAILESADQDLFVRPAQIAALAEAGYLERVA
jgi:UDP-N-acetylglucosamine 3-dehydrogenase